MLVDHFGRQITYLRVSVTDRCNLRCVYCMPPEGVSWMPHEKILSFEEIARVVREAASLGVRKVRLTGGEPLIRRDLPDLVRLIAGTPGIEDISLTTNALLLERMAARLKEAGLHRINVSLDTLKADRFERITRGGSLDTVWRGLLAAERCGLMPIKINVVALRGVNEDELRDLASLSIEHEWHVRFIELMPVNNQQPWGPDFPTPQEAYLSIPAIKKALAPLGLAPAPGSALDGPAQEFTLVGGRGRIGFISPLSNHFCQDCNRLRLTADGNFRACLLQDVEVPFLQALRAGESIQPYILEAVNQKPKGHELETHHLPTSRRMQQIGG
jgi:cyclic pyranopterin phosphate synthase